MKESKSQFIELIDLEFLINALKDKFTVTYESSKHKLIFQGEEDSPISLRLPIPYIYNNNRESDPEEWITPYIICIIQSGSAALAYCEGLQIIEHKVFKAYMVRKKQGMSQLKYLKTKGKSKAGSRVRLGNTTHFFEEIIEKLSDWLDYYETEKIALSLNKTLYPYLFNKDNEVLDKNDHRIYKIPKHIEDPSFENLLKIHIYLLKGEIIYDESQKLFVEKILQKLNE